MKIFVYAAMLSLCLGMTQAQAAEGGFLRGKLKERLQERQAGKDDRMAGESPDIKKKIALPEGARLVSDVSFGPHGKQAFDVYIPAGASNAPMIVMVHGGAWALGDKTHFRVTGNKIGHWLPKGYIFISVNYRLVPDADPLQQAEDVASALAAIQKRAGEWGGDPSRILLMGHSAGAHLVALLGADPAQARAWGAAPWRGTVVLDSACMDVPSVMNRQRKPKFYEKAFGEDPAFWEKTSPIHRLGENVSPMLVVCSTERQDKPCLQAHKFSAAMKAKGFDSGVLSVDLSHSEINENLGLPGGYTDAVDAFIKKVL